MSRQYDTIIIGAGQAGPSLADRLTSEGKNVALIERSHPGGTCVNTGCIPTKALVASARAAHVARHAQEFGVVVQGEVTVDMKRVNARKDEIALASRAGVTSWLEGMSGLTFVRGHARFEDNHRVRVGDEVLSADQIFINVGARPRMPDFGSQGELWTSSDMMDVDELPAHLVIIGAGPIGLEFAQMYRRFGSEVTLIDMADRLLPREDEEVSKTLETLLTDEGITVELSARCVAVEGKIGALTVNVSCGDTPKVVKGSHVLVAVGRVPNTHDLGLENTDIRIDDRGFIEVDDELATSAAGVWALGEVNRRGAFTHTTYNDFEIVAENLLDGAQRRVTDRIPISGIFTDPPLARVGYNDAEARASGKNVLVGHRPMSRVGRARERGETVGFMKILVDADSKQILGATILGIGGDEAIHAVADLMYAKAPYEVLRRAVHMHPTVAELLPTLVGSLVPLD
ncbi:MAG: FAD-containing oxidoreductase [Nannocystaceae bacterium]|nr:FAD-containing oxidoreductase [Nannocystaceae bacterium]